MFPYTLIRSRRKTAAIYITKNAEVEVRAPLRMPRKDIDQFVASKEKWIASHIGRREWMNSEKAAFALGYGDTVPLCGKMVPIREREGDQIGFDGECFFLPAGLSSDEIKQAVVQVYQMAAKQILNARVDEYAKRMHVRPTAVRITSARTRWGSCSGKNGINFSWRLVMADQSAIDYVVVHELAHIREHNHSPRFWAEVESVMPDYGQRKMHLKVLQDRLSRENWEI